MKIFAPLFLLSLLMLSACTDEAQEAIDKANEVKGQLEDIRDKAVETKQKVDQKIEEVKDAKQKIDEASAAIDSALEAVNKVKTLESANQKEASTEAPSIIDPMESVKSN